MKLKVKYLGFSLLLGATALGTSSCNDLLDLAPNRNDIKAMRAADII